jgi:hypothetical protein
MENMQNDFIISDIERNEGINGELYISPDYPLTEWYNVVRNKRISELSDSDVSKFIRQRLFLIYVVPEVLKRLKKDPTIGELYCGEMLTALYKVEDAFWMDRGVLLEEAQNLLSELSGDKTINSFEWLYEGEEQEFYNKIKLFSEKLSRIKFPISGSTI